ncbi:MAG: pitrilysin family protein [Sphingomicrobium sp.]
MAIFLYRAATAAAVVAALLASAPTLATAAAPTSVPIASLIKQVGIPHNSFTLANGLKVIVHEDRKAPIVAVNVWYNVGSKDEPAGKTGFAHLFEHLMFNGTQNAPGDYFTHLQDIGATDYNGTTNNDRTTYYETVPSGALERALFLESDRMGWLLGAVTQGVLDNQRSVVQNEKRQGDSRPGGLMQYTLFENLYPAGHPYSHSVIGSMADLDAASLTDVKQWFREKYAPNNAVLVIAGDVDPATVQPLVEKYFAAIPAGPVNRPALATIPTLSAPKAIALKDAVAMTVIQRFWAVPGLLDKDLAALDIGGAVLGGLASSRLDAAMVRDEQVAVAVSAGLSPLQRAGVFSVSAYVKPGTDPGKVGARLDQLVADFIAKGPSTDEVARAVMAVVSNQIRSLEGVGGGGGKGATLAEGAVYAGDSEFYRKTLATYAAIQPATVRSAMQRWLRRPPLTITLAPGERGAAYGEAKAVEPVKPADKKAATIPTRIAPPVSDVAALDFPDIQHARLSNGIAVNYVQRGALPLTQVALAFEAGSAADPLDRRGLASLTMDLLDEGTASLTSQQFAEAKERLGADLSTSNTQDRSLIYLSALTPNLAPSLDLLSDLTRNAALRPADIDRLNSQRLTAIDQSRKDPTKAGQRLLPVVLYGANHPYGGPPSGDATAIAAFARGDFASFRERWLRPDNVKIFIVSDRPWAELKPLIESRFGDWAAPTVAKGVKLFPPPAPRPTKPRILLVDRPGAPQSGIVGAQLLPIDAKGDIIPFNTANEVLGGTFLSRLNMDLRESKGWSYGVRGNANFNAHAVPYIISAPVQGDRTGEAIAALNQQVGDFLTTRGVDADELKRTVANNVKQLPGEFETSGAVLGAMLNIDLLGRPDNYYETLADRYRAQTIQSLDAAARAAIDPKAFVWIVTGDAAKVKPQLDKLGMSVEVVEAP